jgi:hypothetical protein
MPGPLFIVCPSLSSKGVTCYLKSCSVWSRVDTSGARQGPPHELRLETDEDGDAQVDVRDLDEVIFLGVAAK